MLDGITALTVLDDLEHAVAGAERGLDRVGQPVAILFPDDEAIHDDGDVVVLVAGQ
jgi:hypothetical protein